MKNHIKYIAIDTRLFSNKNNWQYLERIFENPKIDLKQIPTLLLTYPETSSYNLLPFESYFSSNIIKIKIENKKYAADIKEIMSYFNKFEHRNLTDVKEKIILGKNILYISTRTASYIHKFKKSEECPGFIQADFCRYCTNNCRYCFLNLTLRVRPFLTMYCDFDTIDKSLKRQKKKNPKRIINTGESGEMGNLNAIFPEYWNIICEIAKKYDRTLLFVTKTDNIDDIPEADNITKNNVYACSINTQKGIDHLEPRTASYKDRIKMLRTAKDKGYRIAARFDPIYIQDLHQTFFHNNTTCNFTDIDISDCYGVLDDLVDLEAESVQFGMFRGLDNLPSYSNMNLPPNYKEIFCLETIESRKKARIKYPINIRKYTYIELLSYIEKIKNKRLCKEPYIKLQQENGTCICNLKSKIS